MAAPHGAGDEYREAAGVSVKPVCVACQRFYRMKKSGFYFIEAMPVPGVRHAEAGTAHPEQWTPYKVWSGDLWECQGCGHQLVSGTGRAPIIEHYQEDFLGAVRRLNAEQFQVNDC